MNPTPICDALLRISKEIDPDELFPTVDPDASRFAVENPFAFALACCLDRGMPSSAVWTVLHELRLALGHLDPERIAAMTLRRLDRVYRSLPRKPRFVNDAPRTTRELAALVATRFAGDAARIWEGRSAEEVKGTLLSVHGVGEGLASVTLLLIEKVYGRRFDERDRPGMDIKADVHTIRVLRRLGLTTSRSARAAVAAARRLQPEYPAGLDEGLWIVGKQWCHPRAPECPACAMEAVCPKVLDASPPP